MEDEGLEDRTEEATAQKRSEWKKEGRVAQSRELIGALVLLALIGVLWAGGQFILKGVWALFQNSWADLNYWTGRDWSVEMVLSIARFSMQAMVYILSPLMAAAMGVGVLSSVMQTGFVWTTKPLEPDLQKIDPMSGLSRIFSMDGLIELLKAVVKFVIVGFVVFTILKKRIGEAGNLWSYEAPVLSQYLGHSIMVVLASVGFSMFLISGADFAWQKLRYERKIRMTKQEVKEESRQMNGNPQIKARIRALQRKMANSKMVDAVKKADVVVTNPTHIAVALMFDRENMHAPKVVAKGVDHMAEQIKKIARENGIPTVENVPLARALYKALKIGQFISRDLYNAVAEVLAYVYRLKGRTL